MRSYLLAALFATGCACWGQSIQVGVKGGLRATGDINGAATSESKRYTAGPMIEIGLLFGFAFEADALYQREGYQTSFANFAGSVFSRESANSWQFPLLLKYKLGFPLVKPYVEAGYAPRIIGGTVTSNSTSFDILTGQQTSSNLKVSTHWDPSQGFVAGGGVQLGVGRLRISPEIRYTYWNNAAITGSYGDGPGYRSSQNQVDLLIGIGWKVL